MLDIKNVTIQYSCETEAVKGVSIHVSPGETVGIVGESGSGKTSVIRSVIGLLPGHGAVTGGDIVFDGKSLLKLTQAQWQKLRGNEISMIFQDSGAMINPIRRVGSQFIEYLRVHSNMTKKEAYARAVELLRLMRLPDGENVMASYPFQLSGGMRQRVGIAMAMAFKPKLLLADEPTSALDVTTQAQIVRQMMEMHESYGTAILLVTHNIGVAAYMSDRLIVMKDGEIVEEGTRDQIIYSPKHDYTKKLLESTPVLDGDTYV